MDNEASQDVGALVLALRRINHALDRHSRRQNTLAGLTAPQALMLASIAQAEAPPSIKALSESLSLSQATTTDISLRLAGKSLVSRHRDPTDGRRTVVSLTPSGQQALATEAGLMPDHFVLQFGALSARRRQRILAGVLDLATLLADPSPKP